MFLKFWIKKILDLSNLNSFKMSDFLKIKKIKFVLVKWLKLLEEDKN